VEIWACKSPDLAFECVFSAKNITWKIIVKSDECNVVIDSTIVNMGADTVSLGKIYLLTAEQSIRMRLPADDMIVLLWRPFETIRGYRLSDNNERANTLQKLHVGSVLGPSLLLSNQHKQ
jgi:hypothetical protein